MKNYHYYYLISFLLCTQTAFAQSNRKAEKAVKATINRFFEGMEKGDTALLKSTCTSAPILQMLIEDTTGTVIVYTQEFQDFVAFVGGPHKDKFKEQIKFGAVHLEKSLASVWMRYVFYLNGKVSHTGTNSFQLVNIGEGWKIQYIIDTRRR